jgi:hypothetical protein
MLSTLLAWLNPLSTILGQIQQWEAKLLDAKTEQERVAAQERIAWYQAAATIAGHPIDVFGASPAGYRSLGLVFVRAHCDATGN